MENAFEVLQVRHRTLGLSVQFEQIDRCWRLPSTPWPLLTRIDPRPPRLCASPAGIEHRNRRIVGKKMIRGKDVLAQSVVQCLEPSRGAADSAGERRTVDLSAMTGKDLRLEVEQRIIAIFADEHLSEERRSCQTAGDGRSGAAACTTLLQVRQAYFGRVIRITRYCAGTQSSISDALSPIRCIGPPQHGQALLGTSSKISSRCR